MNCEYCYYYSECLKTLEKKNNEIELLKKNYTTLKEVN